MKTKLIILALYLAASFAVAEDIDYRAALKRAHDRLNYLQTERRDYRKPRPMTAGFGEGALATHWAAYRGRSTLGSLTRLGGRYWCLRRGTRSNSRRHSDARPAQRLARYYRWCGRRAYKPRSAIRYFSSATDVHFAARRFRCQCMDQAKSQMTATPNQHRWYGSRSCIRKCGVLSF